MTMAARLQLSSFGLAKYASTPAIVMYDPVGIPFVIDPDRQHDLGIPFMSPGYVCLKLRLGNCIQCDNNGGLLEYSDYEEVLIVGLELACIRYY